MVQQRQQVVSRFGRNMVRHIALGGLLASSLFAAGNKALAGESANPVELLTRMAEALKNTTYRGTFVHMANGHVETMRLLHSNEGGTTRERMTSLNGEAREVFRNNSLVTCIWPGSRSVIVSKSKPRDLIPQIGAELTSSDAYIFKTEADDRVAGMPTYVVSVMPKDQYRYGYRFWIDKSNHVMLRSMLLDERQNSLEQVMFTDISYPETIDLAELEADAESRGGYSWVENTESKTSSGVDRISFNALPSGYQELTEKYEPMPMSDSAVSHVVVSDGVASVSVYVEYTAAKSGAESGVSSMGAINAYGRTLEDAFVTVVGEVPVATVRAIGDAVLVQRTH